MKGSVMYHFTTVKMAVIKKDTETSICKNTEKRKRAPVLCLELKNLARRKSEKEHEDE